MMYDVSGGVEPYFALSYYYKGILGGQELTYVNKHLRKSLEKRNLYSEDLMKKIIHEGTLQKIQGNVEPIVFMNRNSSRYQKNFRYFNGYQC